MSIYKKYQGYEHLHPDENIESGEMSVNIASNIQYNYVPQHGYFFPGSGLNYVIGIDGHRTLVQQSKLTKPTALLGAMFCPCFTAEEPLSIESKLRYKNCLLSFTFFISLAQLIFLGVVLRDGIAPIRQNYSVGPTSETLIEYGAKLTHLILHKTEFWRIFSSTFLYAGIFHAVFNLIIQFRLGMYLEREWGTPLFVVTYLVSGLSGTLASCIFEPSAVGVGASGAVAGLVSAYGIQIALYFKAFDKFQAKLQILQFSTFFIMVLILILCPFVNWSNVAGGLFAGVLLGFATRDIEERRIYWIIPSLFLLVFLAAGFCYLFLFMN